MWIKSEVGVSSVNTLLSIGPEFSASYEAWALALNDAVNSAGVDFPASALGFYFGAYGGAWKGDQTGKYRDPAAWYHIVAQTDGLTNTLFVNGQQVFQTDSTAEILDPTITVGNFPPGWALPYNLRGYMADVYFIDGQALEPTAFGRLDDNGVWVPKKVDFTPAKMRLSDYFTVSSGGWYAGFGPSDLFAGGAASAVDTDAVVTFAPAEPVMVTSTLAMKLGQEANTCTVSWYGEDVVNDVGVNVSKTYYTVSGAPKEISAEHPLVITPNPGQSIVVGEIAVDGLRLYNPYIWSADLTATDNWDSPPSNAFTGQVDSLTAAKMPNNSTGSITWTPSTPIPFNNTVEVWANCDAFLFFGEDPNPVGTATDGWVTVATGGGQITSIELAHQSNAVWLNAVRVDGQILKDGTNPSFGANGFHLEFSNPANVGFDSSGSGNHFEATGFDAAPVGIFSQQMINPPSGYAAGNGPSNLFDGDTGTYAITAVSDESFTFTPTYSISYTQLEYYTYGSTWVLNGTVAGGNNGDFGWSVIDGAPGQLETLEFTAPAGSRPAVGAIRINGNLILTNNAGTDYDLMQDSPTQNYATWNPLFTNGSGASGTFSVANLGYTGFTTPGYKTTSATQSLKDGAYYWEYTAGAISNSYPGGVGIIRGTNPAESTYIGYDTNNNVYGFGLWYTGDVHGDTAGEGTTSANVLATLSSGITAGDVIGMQCDIPNNRVAWYKNNVLAYEITNVNSEYDWRPAADQFYDIPQNYVNFGQRPFVYTPPEGFSALQTQNFSDATIPNGRDHFEAVTFAAGSGGTVSGMNFAPDFIWAKSRNNPWNHRLYDTIRGTGKYLSSNNSAAEDTSDTDGVLSFNSDGFTHGDFGGGQDMVAWCWKAGGAAVANSAGSIPSQVSANTDAGFSIVNYSGTGAVGTVGHGLDSAPEFMLIKNRNRSASWVAWFNTFTDQQWIPLNTGDSVQSDSNAWSGLPTNTVIQVGTGSGADTNQPTAANNMLAYCWHSVPGYSAFGSFQGNSSADGPFIFTGFRPAWICYKVINQSNSWQVIDATRDPINNGTSTVLQPNEPNSESTGILDSVDILSNGFKIRDSGGFNSTGWQICYAAFAENPFGGDNIAPANAR